MVECEYTVVNTPFDIFFVLIDTWWNVNLIQAYVSMKKVHVLIDTWWNVNEEITSDVVTKDAF